MAQVTHSGLPRPDGLIEVDTVLDIGPGIRPMGWYTPKRHICVEPYTPYADMLEAAGFVGYNLLRMTALQALEGYSDYPGTVDAVYMLDVLEHMTREEGEEVLRLAKALEPKQIVVATPVGFHPQEGDAWGLGGEYWQKHRSGWLPKDFPGWTISRYDNGTRAGGFVAIR